MNITEWSFNAQYVNVWSADLEVLSTRCQERVSHSQIYRKTQSSTYRRAVGTYEAKQYDFYK